MSDAENPYQPPAAADEAPLSQGEMGEATAATRQLLGKAGPWLKFLGIMGYIGCGFMAVFGVIFLVLPLTGDNVFGSTSQSRLVGPALALFYLALGIVLFFPARFIHKMGSRSTQYQQDGDATTLEGVALHLKQVAKFYGIVTIVGLASIPVILVVSIIAAAAGSSSG